MWLLSFVFLVSARAQLGISISSSPNPVLITQPLVYQVRVGNLVTTIQSGVVVTNVLPDGMELVGTSSNVLSVTNSAGVLVFRIRTLEVNDSLTLSITGRPTRLGLITNIASATGPFVGPFFATNTTTVQNLQADLAVSVSATELNPLAGQPFNYQVAVTNIGPGDVSGVVATTVIPTNLVFVGISPSSQTFSLSNTTVRVALGALNSAAATNFTISLRATNAGSATLTTAVSASNNSDPVSANNSASQAVFVTSVLDGDLSWEQLGAGVFDPQTGLILQAFRISNDGTNSVPGARVFVDGLTNRLVNASGTNSGRAFVNLLTPLAPGAVTDIVLEYVSPTRTPVPPATVSLEVVPINPTVVTPPTGGTSPARVVTLADGRVLIEFPSEAGKTYRLVYSAAASFDGARVAVPDVAALANRTQWIDDGPPKTVSRPANAASRFYRIVEVTQ